MNGKENRSPPFFDSLSLSTLGANYACFANELSGAVAFFPFPRFSLPPLIVSSPSSSGKPIGVESKRAEKRRRREAASSSPGKHEGSEWIYGGHRGDNGRSH